MAAQRWFVHIGVLLWFTAAAWAEPYVCPAGCFSADLSNATIKSVNQSESVLGTVVTTVYLDRQKSRFLTVSYTDLPKLALLAGLDTIFEQARDGMLEQCSGVQAGWVRQDRFTRRLTYRVNQGPTYRGETVFHLEKYRLYVVDVRSETSTKPALDAQFLASFKILPPSATASAPASIQAP